MVNILATAQNAALIYRDGTTGDRVPCCFESQKVGPTRWHLYVLSTFRLENKVHKSPRGVGFYVGDTLVFLSNTRDMDRLASKGIFKRGVRKGDIFPFLPSDRPVVSSYHSAPKEGGDELVSEQSAELLYEDGTTGDRVPCGFVTRLSGYDNCISHELVFLRELRNERHESPIGIVLYAGNTFAGAMPLGDSRCRVDFDQVHSLGNWTADVSLETGGTISMQKGGGIEIKQPDSGHTGFSPKWLLGAFKGSRS